MALAAPDDKVPLPHVQKIIEQIARDHGFKNPRYDVRPGSKAGDNYSSVMYRVEVSEAEDAGRKLALMAKTAHQNPAIRASMKLHTAFTNENVFYNHILTTYVEKLRERGLMSEDEFYPDAARCFQVSLGDGTDDDDDKNVVVLQDMRPLGYVMHDRRKGLDEAHCRVLLGALGRLHGNSLALEHLHPLEHERLRNSTCEIFYENMDFITQTFDKETVTKSVLGMIQSRFPEGTLEHKRAVDYCAILQKDIMELIKLDPEGGNVICHGDCWTNNILFKYADSGKVEATCLVDFQVTRYASPVLDLSYFIYTCTEKAMRDAHLDSLLRGYIAEMHATMRKLGVKDPDSLYSWEVLQRQLRRYCRYGFIMAMLVIPIFLAEQDEVPDLGSRLEQGVKFHMLFAIDTKDTTERDRRITDVVQEMVDKDYI